MEKATIQKLILPRGRRVLAVSDVHGDLPLLQKLLDKACFCADDILFVLGDILEKGAGSLDTLRYFMALSKTRTVHMVNGNCDDLVVGFADGWMRDEFFRSYIPSFGRRCTMVQMGREAGLTDAEMEDYPRFRAVLRERFGPELDFLRSFPTIIDTEKLLFVHGGVPSDEHMEELDAWHCMKNDGYAEQSPKLSKWAIVGHTPVTLYRPHIPCANPLITAEKKIVSIDGGCSIKPDAQLNLLVLADGYSQDFRFISADLLPTVTALDPQAPSAGSINIRWGGNTVEVLERGEEFSRCRHTESGRVMDFLTDYLYEADGKTCCQDSTDYALAVAPGDCLSLVRRTSRGLLVKKDGVTGWYRGRVG